MEVFKTLLMGCGALALLSAVGCVGLVGAGTYAIDRAVDEARAEGAFDQPASGKSYRPKSTGSDGDPFGEYQPKTYDADGNEIGGWGDDAQ